jgi:hypothetical protein
MAKCSLRKTLRAVSDGRTRRRLAPCFVTLAFLACRYLWGHSSMFADLTVRVARSAKRRCFMSSGFDSIAESAFELSQLQERDTSERQNFTWKRGSGGLADSDRKLLARSYLGVKSVFEFGLGESTRIAAAANVVRYTGVDSDALYVSQSRAEAPKHFKFLFADIGETKSWGQPGEALRKQSMQYQIAPLLSELRPFEVYFVDGRFRVACVCAALLHASKFNSFDSKIFMHDYKARPQYHIVEQFADIIEISKSGRLVHLRRSKNASEALIMSVWNSAHMKTD